MVGAPSVAGREQAEAQLKALQGQVKSLQIQCAALQQVCMVPPHHPRPSSAHSSDDSATECTSAMPSHLHSEGPKNIQDLGQNWNIHAEPNHPRLMLTGSRCRPREQAGAY